MPMRTWMKRFLIRNIALVVCRITTGAKGVKGENKWCKVTRVEIRKPLWLWWWMSVVEDKRALIAFLSQSTVVCWSYKESEPVMIKERTLPSSREGRGETKRIKSEATRLSTASPSTQKHKYQEGKAQDWIPGVSLDSTFSFLRCERERENQNRWSTPINISSRDDDHCRRIFISSFSYPSLLLSHNSTSSSSSQSAILTMAGVSFCLGHLTLTIMYVLTHLQSLSFRLTSKTFHLKSILKVSRGLPI